jgi:hypothetical protein
MKPYFAALFATAVVCLLTACAGTGGGPAAGGSSSGVTVFGTVDAGVSSYKNQSR